MRFLSDPSRNKCVCVRYLTLRTHQESLLWISCDSSMSVMPTRQQCYYLHKFIPVVSVRDFFLPHFSPLKTVDRGKRKIPLSLTYFAMSPCKPLKDRARKVDGNKLPCSIFTCTSFIHSFDSFSTLELGVFAVRRNSCVGGNLSVFGI